jgi:hypothetical protein
VDDKPTRSPRFGGARSKAASVSSPDGLRELEDDSARWGPPVGRREKSQEALGSASLAGPRRPSAHT